MPRYTVQMHIHGSGSEGRASMLAQDEMGATTGVVDGIWWTEHDWRLVNFQKLESVQFTGMTERYSYPARYAEKAPGTEEIVAEWVPSDSVAEADVAAEITTERSFEGESSMRVRASAAGDRTVAPRWELDVDNHRETYPLFSEPTITLAVYPVSENSNGAPFVEFELSEQPPDLHQPRIRYVFTQAGESLPFEDDHWTETVPVERGQWNEVTLEPAADVSNLDLPAEGLDNAIGRRGICIGATTSEGTTEAYFDTLAITPTYEGNTLVEKHKEIVESLPTELSQFHGLEISWYGQHVNAFGTDIPAPAYRKREPVELNTSGIVDHIHDHGGIASYNHPDTSDIDAHAVQLAEAEMYGADLMEVGHKFTDPRERLELWDRIGQEGVVVTGLGVGDIHHASGNWTADDPGKSYWVTHIWAPRFKEGPLLDALSHGRAYFAKPDEFSGRLDIEGEGALRMGGVAVDTGSRQLTATVTDAAAGDTLRWVCNGKTLSTKALDTSDATVTVDVPSDEGVRVVRFEIRRSVDHRDEALIVACSNPVYLFGHRERLSPIQSKERIV